MPVTVVVGGQFGSEGKGKVARFLASEMGASAAVRVGGPNSGHTVIIESGDAVVFRQLPTAAVLGNVVCVLPAGSYISPALLMQELATSGLRGEYLVIDSNAVIIDDHDIEQETSSGLVEAIGSTASGTGSAVLKRINRTNKTYLAKDTPELRPFVRETATYLRDCLDRRERVLIEGTQGFGLSLLHSPFYPYVTSRDTTASGFLAEAGLSPLDVDDIVLVMRAFPIRVGGKSGPLANEVQWSTIMLEGGHSSQLVEFTSVTRKPRRVARFDPEIVKRAISVNRPTRLVLNHLDYVDATVQSQSQLSSVAVSFLEMVEGLLNRHIEYVGVGPDQVIPRMRAHTRRRLG